jgi:prolyl-tRNA editing enzyme YbaK/EbsC (Cys-tRNA(Pro) deacylase)
MGHDLVRNGGEVLHIFGRGEPVGVVAGIMRVIDDTYDEVERILFEGGIE